MKRSTNRVSIDKATQCLYLLVLAYRNNKNKWDGGSAMFDCWLPQCIGRCAIDQVGMSQHAAVEEDHFSPFIIAVPLMLLGKNKIKDGETERRASSPWRCRVKMSVTAREWTHCSVTARHTLFPHLDYSVDKLQRCMCWNIAVSFTQIYIFQYYNSTLVLKCITIHLGSLTNYNLSR